MGMFFNPDNSAFQVALNSEIYIDKTGLLEYTNKQLNTKQALICNSRPRRFGKSTTADMLTAYYSKGCKSEELFKGKAISKSMSFYTHLNQYNLIHFDVQWCLTQVNAAEDVVIFIEKNIIKELKNSYFNIIPSSIKTLSATLAYIYNETKNKFIIIIDEWDVLIRDEAANTAVQKNYINFLQSIFKGTEPTKYISLAFLTGILPIKKVKTQSAMNNFDEFTMIDPSIFTPYIGFTEKEVIELCERYHKDFEEVKRWYDGYELNNCHVYNPKAVVSVMLRGDFQSYWSQTGTYESILSLIDKNFDGLRTSIIAMLSGDSIKVKTKSYQNDMITFKNKDDVITALIHLGYLAYHQKSQTAFIPNEEIRTEFAEALEENKWNEFIDFQKRSEKLLSATLNMNEKEVAEVIEDIHHKYVSAIQYNDENSLSSVLTIAYLSAMQYYFIPIREMPAGKGFADFIFLPKTEYINEIPALLIELKWNKSVNTVIQQIKDKNYTEALERYTGDILLVGINYDKKTKKHQCLIEQFKK